MKRPGITLIELLIAFSISSLLFIALGSITWQLYRSYSITLAEVQLESTQLTALNRITRMLQEGRQIMNSVDNYTTSDARLVVLIPSIDSANTILFGRTDTFVYQLDPNDPTMLQEVIIPHQDSHREAQTRILLRNVDDLTFNYYDPNGALITTNNYANTKQIVINLTSQRTTYQQTISRQQTQRITLRNQ